jgi:hypothetical protein
VYGLLLNQIGCAKLNAVINEARATHNFAWMQETERSSMPEARFSTALQAGCSFRSVVL